MKSFLIAAATLAVGAFAAPFGPHSGDACMSTADAQRVAQNFRALINQDFNITLARTAMTKDFTDYSDGVNELINQGCPNGPATLGEPTFTSRKEFIAGQSQQPPIPFKILNLWNTCDAVFIRWRTGAPGTVQPEQPVTGIIAIETKANGHPNPIEPWLIQTVYSEFNSGAWLYDLGVFQPTCDSSKRSIGGLPTIL